MPEFGVMFKLDADYDHVTWYGMGPEETYVDRCAGAKLGVYKNKVEDNMKKFNAEQQSILAWLTEEIRTSKPEEQAAFIREIKRRIRNE